MITKDNTAVREAFEASAFLRRLSFKPDVIASLNQVFKEQVTAEQLQKWAGSICEMTRSTRSQLSPPRPVRKGKYDIGPT